MRHRPQGRWTRKQLVSFGIPAVLIPGIMLAIALGWNPTNLVTSQNYYSNKSIFPESGFVQEVIDGDTLQLESGVEVRLLGIDAPGRGEKRETEAARALDQLTKNKRLYLEYDRYQDDKYGRILAWVWVDCESEPAFLPADYMHLSGNASKSGLTNNPDGCAKGSLINERLVQSGLAVPVSYTDRGNLKYEERISQLKRKH